MMPPCAAEVSWEAVEDKAAYSTLIRVVFALAKGDDAEVSR